MAHPPLLPQLLQEEFYQCREVQARSTPFWNFCSQVSIIPLWDISKEIQLILLLTFLLLVPFQIPRLPFIRTLDFGGFSRKVIPTFTKVFPNSLKISPTNFLFGHSFLVKKFSPFWPKERD